MTPVSSLGFIDHSPFERKDHPGAGRGSGPRVGVLMRTECIAAAATARENASRAKRA